MMGGSIAGIMIVGGIGNEGAFEASFLYTKVLNIYIGKKPQFGEEEYSLTISD